MKKRNTNKCYFMSHRYAAGGNISGILNNTLPVLNGAMGVLSSAVDLGSIRDTTNDSVLINDFANTNFSGNSVDSLLGEWNSTDFLDNQYDMEDIRGYSNGEMAGKIVGSIGKGALAGAKFGPYSALIGGAIGGISSGIGAVVGTNKAKRKAEELERLQNKANAQVIDTFDSQAQEVNAQNFNNRTFAADGGKIHIKKKNRGKFTAAAKKAGMGVQEYASHVLANKERYSPTLVKRANFARNATKFKHALGGPLNTHGTEWGNGLTYINTGGTHEQNPFNGVQMGMDAQNIPNLVEEGEVIFNDYVFSNRLHPTKEELENVNLPNKYKNSSFAYIAEDLGKESSERPNDPISRRGLEDMMSRLATAQEIQRKKKGKKGTQNLMAGGGDLNTYKNFTLLPEDTAFYNPEYLGFWNYLSKNRNSEIGKSLLNDINEGKFGDIGGNTFTLDDILRLSRDYKKGPVHQAFLKYASDYNNNPELLDINIEGASIDPATLEAEKKALQDALAYESLNVPLMEMPSDELDSSLRYAPAIGSAIGALQSAFATPDYEHADYLTREANHLEAPQVRFKPLNRYLRYNPIDRNYLLNQLKSQAGATKRMIRNSGTNPGTTMAGLLAADYNAQNAVGNNLIQMQQYNDALRQRVEDFNRGTDQYNSQGFLQSDTFNAESKANRDALRLSYMDRAAQMRENADAQLEASRNANITNFLDNLGGIGTENFIMNQIRSNPANQGTYTDALKGIIGYRGANGGMLTKKNNRRKR